MNSWGLYGSHVLGSNVVTKKIGFSVTSKFKSQAYDLHNWDLLTRQFYVFLSPMYILLY